MSVSVGDVTAILGIAIAGAAVLNTGRMTRLTLDHDTTARREERTGTRRIEAYQALTEWCLTVKSVLEATRPLVSTNSPQPVPAIPDEAEVRRLEIGVRLFGSDSVDKALLALTPPLFQLPYINSELADQEQRQSQTPLSAVKTWSGRTHQEALKEYRELRDKTVRQVDALIDLMRDELREATGQIRKDARRLGLQKEGK